MKKCLICGQNKFGIENCLGIKICFTCLNEMEEGTKGMGYLDFLEVPVKYDKQAEFRNCISNTTAKIINVIEIKNNKFLLFIIDPCGTESKLIMSAGFKTFLNKDRAAEPESNRQNLTAPNK
jgi:hypothetical protein